MYSLVSSPVIGFDLSRSPGGAALAEILLVALALDEAALPRLAEAYDDSGRASAWLEIGQVAAAGRGIRDVLADRHLTEGDLPRGPRSRELAAMLEQAPLGNLDSLLTCIRTDVFDWTWTQQADGTKTQSEVAGRALTVICDAAAAAYLAGRLSPSAHEGLMAPWFVALANLPVSAMNKDLEIPADVTEVLRRVRVAGEKEYAQMVRTADRWRTRRPTWAEAVHDASWAVALTNRTREAARVQLLLVVAVRGAGWPVAALAGGDWNTLSGAVSALLVKDVVSEESAHRLLAPYLEAFGPLGAWGGQQAA